MSRSAPRHAVPRPRPLAAVLNPRAVLPATAAIGLLVSLTGSGTAAAANAVPAAALSAVDTAALASSLAARETARDDRAPLPVEDVRALADTAIRERGIARAQRATAQREDIAARKVKAARAAKAKAAAVAKARRWVTPIAKPLLTSNFGYRWGRLHAGLDFSAPVGTPLRAMSAGTVVKAESAQGYGLKLEIRYWDGTVSYYGHLSQLDVKAGQRVTPGMPVGLSGNTGFSTGPHLHLEIHPGGKDPIDPKPWLTARKIKF